jgi:hypothetical protein
LKYLARDLYTVQRALFYKSGTTEIGGADWVRILLSPSEKEDWYLLGPAMPPRLFVKNKKAFETFLICLEIDYYPFPNRSNFFARE